MVTPIIPKGGIKSTIETIRTIKDINVTLEFALSFPLIFREKTNRSQNVLVSWPMAKINNTLPLFQILRRKETLQFPKIVSGEEKQVLKV